MSCPPDDLTIDHLVRRMLELRARGTKLTLLAVCPNSSAVLEAAVLTAARNRMPMLLAATLNQVDRDVQKRIFESLNSMNPALSDEIRANMFTFDDIVKLDDRSVQRVIRDINKQDLSLALKGAPDKMREVFFRNLSERARENLKDEIDILGPQLAKNVYAAQRRIVDIVRSLEEKEEIIIAGGGEEYAIIA